MDKPWKMALASMAETVGCLLVRPNGRIRSPGYEIVFITLGMLLGYWLA